MTRTALYAAIDEAERFLERARALKTAANKGDKGTLWLLDWPVQQGAVKRASMDLTRALAELRRGR